MEGPRQLHPVPAVLLRLVQGVVCPLERIIWPNSSPGMSKHNFVERGQTSINSVWSGKVLRMGHGGLDIEQAHALLLTPGLLHDWLLLL